MNTCAFHLLVNDYPDKNPVFVGLYQGVGYPLGAQHKDHDVNGLMGGEKLVHDTVNDPVFRGEKDSRPRFHDASICFFINPGFPQGKRLNQPFLCALKVPVPVRAPEKPPLAYAFAGS